MAKIYIHVGHGGTDPGAIGPTGLKEKDVALEISKRIKTLLEQHGQIVKLSRDKDTTLKSPEAARIANQWKADYIISVHLNSASNPKATGTETFAYSTTSKGKSLAEKVQANLVEAIQLSSRGVKYRNNLAILANTNAPAILVEVAFINNPIEEQLLKDSKFLDKAAVGITKGLLAHIGIETVKVEYKGILNLVIGIFQNNKNYVGIRELLEPMGHKLEWEQRTQTVVVK